MQKSRFTDEQIVAIVREAESGARAADVCRRLPAPRPEQGDATALAREVPRDGTPGSQTLKALEEENRRLKRLVAELALDNSLLKDVVGRKW